MLIVIPARYKSSRLPGKPLADICGKSLIQRVYECATSTKADRIVVATDDKRIQKAVEDFGGEACMTSATHQSGTDRISEVIKILGIQQQEIIVNLQGDEPLMPATLIQKVADTLENRPDAVMATGCCILNDLTTLQNPNVVKVVCDKHGYALYFSRAAIPWPRDVMKSDSNNHNEQDQLNAFRHIGLYAYRADFVSRYAAWPVCSLELSEQLEQLRVLWNGERIAVCVADSSPGTGVDTPEDLEIVRNHFRGIND